MGKIKDFFKRVKNKFGKASMENQEKPSLLTEPEQIRIKEEEEIREEVRKAKTTGFWNGVLHFLNTPFGIFLCSSIILASFTTLFTNYQTERKQKSEDLKVANKFDDEINKRLQDAEAYLGSLENEMQNPATNSDEITLPSNISDPRFINDRIFYYLDGKTFHESSNIVTNEPFYPEYKDVRFYRLLNELRNFVPDEEKPALLCATEKYRAIENSIPTADDFSARRTEVKENVLKAKDVSQIVVNQLLEIEKDAIERFRAQLTELRNLRWNKKTQKKSEAVCKP